jgi:putative methyltransferase
LEALVSHLEGKGMRRLDEPVWPIPVGKWFMDEHLGEALLVFEQGTSWWVGDAWYEAGAVILQDKASCFPATILMDGWVEGEGECLDAT